ncbi:MAG: helix-turn-helix transcriptional regulator [Gemmatimonadota bacterium]
MAFRGEQLRVIRLLRNLNQRELADQVALSAASISLYENNQGEPDAEVVDALCDVLHVTPPVFWAETVQLDDSRPNFRSQRATSQRLQNRIRAHVTLLASWVRHIQSTVRLPSYDVPVIRAATPDQIEAAAERCRERWGLGQGPIRQVVRVLENAGVIITEIEDDARQIDAFSTFDGEPRIVALGTAKGSPSRTVASAR